MRAFVVFSFSIPSQKIGLRKRLRNDPFRVEWDIKPQLDQSIKQLQKSVFLIPLLECICRLTNLLHIFNVHNKMTATMTRITSGPIKLTWGGIAFSALTLLVGRQEGHIRPVKNWVVGCWRGYLSGARCRPAYGQLMTLPRTVSRFSKIQIVFTFLVPAHPGSPGQKAVKRVCVCVRRHRRCARIDLSYSPKWQQCPTAHQFCRNHGHDEQTYTHTMILCRNRPYCHDMHAMRPNNDNDADDDWRTKTPI